MSILDSLKAWARGGSKKEPEALLPGQDPATSTERGLRTTPEQMLEIEMQRLLPNYTLRAKILEIREMDERDPRVKKIHERTARAAVKGGLMLEGATNSGRVQDLWTEYVRRVALHRQEKLESDMRGLVMEGNLPLQWVLDGETRMVCAGIRMPAETLKPMVNSAGQFANPAVAYEQYDYLSGQVIAKFPLWQLNMVRLRPDNYDNWGSFGRPYLDATRSVWRQLAMTEKDLVIRRHTRAPQRLSHVLEGATKDELKTYESEQTNKQNMVTTDFYANRKGGVTEIPGDANLDHIADVAHLLDTFFAGAPAPKGLFGYVGDLSRDILEDIKRDYYDELDAMQDTASFAYELGFRLDLLLRGINPDADPFCVKFIARRTDTPNQRADLALKYAALGAPADMIWRTAGHDPVQIKKQLDKQGPAGPYPSPGNIGIPEPKAGGVKVTPGNQRKGESATYVGNGALQ